MKSCCLLELLPNSCAQYCKPNMIQYTTCVLMCLVPVSWSARSRWLLTFGGKSPGRSTGGRGCSRWLLGTRTGTGPRSRTPGPRGYRECRQRRGKRKEEKSRHSFNKVRIEAFIQQGRKWKQNRNHALLSVYLLKNLAFLDNVHVYNIINNNNDNSTDHAGVAVELEEVEEHAAVGGAAAARAVHVP